MNTKLERLEKKLNIASDMIKEFEIDDIISESLPIISTGAPVPAIIEEDDPQLFELSNLKADFGLIRQNIMKLIQTGQRLLDSVSVIDPSDMKASQIQAIAGLLETVGSNLKLLIDLYKQINEIEVMRSKKNSKFTEQANQTISTGNNITNNQILFAGSSTDLLQLIKDNSTL